MSEGTMKADRWKLGLSLFWFLFTFSLTAWWWIFSLRQLDLLGELLEPEKYASLRRMLLWEGLVLLTAVFGGGLVLVILTNRERSRNHSLRHFFSNFTHDLKTSLSRLRIRTEVLSEKNRDPQFQKLLEEVSRLDLQLENSLWVARGEGQKLLKQEIALSQVVGSLRVEWPELEIQLHQDARIQGDEQALRSVFRNLFQNSWLHGKAQKIEIRPELVRDRFKISVVDDGQGFQGKRSQLGLQFARSQSTQGHGLGLYLIRDLMRRMNGELQFQDSPQGFVVVLEIPAGVK